LRDSRITASGVAIDPAYERAVSAASRARNKKRKREEKCTPASKRNNRKSEVAPDIEALASETERFVRNAYNDYYYIPNPAVPKRERSQGRFTVLRLFKNINHAANGEPSFGVKDSVSQDPATRAGISLTGRRSANQKSADPMNTLRTKRPV
jgi:hypothetical protein